VSRVPTKTKGDRLAADEVNAIVRQAWRSDSPAVGMFERIFDWVERVVVEVASHDAISAFGDVTYSLRMENGELEADVAWQRRFVPAVYEAEHLVRPAPVGTMGLLMRFPADSEAGEQRYKARFWLLDEQAARTPCVPA